MERLVEQLQREQQDILLETKRRTGITTPRAPRFRPSTEDTPLPEGLVLLLKQEVNGGRSSPLMSKDAMTSGCNFTLLLIFGPVISARIQHQDWCLDIDLQNKKHRS
jgi:hypothetical protein